MASSIYVREFDRLFQTPMCYPAGFTVAAAGYGKIAFPAIQLDVAGDGDISRTSIISAESRPVPYLRSLTAPSPSNRNI
jgi:hypothetical protein